MNLNLTEEQFRSEIISSLRQEGLIIVGSRKGLKIPTTIGFGLQNKSNVKITILNAIGEEVAVVLNEVREPGFHQVEFNAAGLPSGIYFYKLQAASGSGVSFVTTKKMLLLK